MMFWNSSSPLFVLLVLFGNRQSYGHNAPDEIDFDTWVDHHEKTYESFVEEQKRQAIFESNMARWERLNQIPGGAFFGPQNNPYADLTVEEFVEIRSSCGGAVTGIDDASTSELSESRTVVTDKATGDTRTTIETERRRRLKKSWTVIDWREANGISYVTPVKNQGPHGTCWSFAVAENLEGLNVRQGYELTNISEQEFISCCSECQGRAGSVSFDWLLNHTGGKPAVADSYPYDGNSSLPCHIDDALRAPVTLHSYGRIQDDGTGLPVTFGLVQKGPMGLGVDATCFHGYQHGIIRNCTSKGINHAVLMVAAGTDVYYEGDDSPTIVDYFTIKNSWGDRWGENGYVRIEQGQDWWGALNLIYTD